MYTRKFELEDKVFVLNMSEHGTRETDGKVQVAYEFYEETRSTDVIFKGEDFYPSERYRALGEEAALSLASFLSLRPGDTDVEYFNDYTDEQMAFANSEYAEALRSQIVVEEYEAAQKKGEIRE